ncbi:DsbA oxidoreductase [Candidatus Caldarchaeum subterraneum]|uniref:DsbA oxidoreductase n=1 Tax=Caldiarchaeum subterraneum TaxID=311458 RepID=E6N707_CALS0|nr:DsbA oxidoreductase [Candidatus Caldarchaeum subterraneum]BAJ50866.1 DsbA oxidoreductase [Candidatus Caldarchaeum subterraneum]
MQPLIEIVEYTDPYCTWCWGSEPVLRKIKEVYGEQVEISYKMGGLVRDIRDFYDPVNEIGGESWYEQVAVHWEDASRRHGMPVDSRVFYEIKDSFTSTYPANIAVKAAEFQDRELAKRYLRRLREGAAAERKHIHRLEVQAELAEEVGLEAGKLVDDIRSGRAEEAFLKDLSECRAMGITGFPTFLVKNLKTGRTHLVYGYRRYSYFEGLLDEISDDSLLKRRIERSEEEVLGFVRRWGKVATQEVATLLDISKNQAFEMLKSMSDKNMVYAKRTGNDYFWLPRMIMECDPETGVCRTL